MAEITRDDLRAWYRVQRDRAADRVRRYALASTPLVPTLELDTICSALGDISVNEAFDALDRRQREIADQQS